MKKLIALLLVIVMVFALAACTTGGDKPVTSSDPASESGSEPANPDEKALKIGIAMQSISTNPIFINAVQMIQTDCDKNDRSCQWRRGHSQRIGELCFRRLRYCHDPRS